MSQNLFKKSVEKYLAIFLLVLFIIFILINNLNIQRKEFNAKNNISNEVHLELSTDDISKAKTVLHTGIYIDRLYDLDSEAKTFKANGWLWVKWKGDKEIESYNPESAKNPILTLSILNAIDWDTYFDEKEPDYYFMEKEGYHYQSKGFSGRFIYDVVDYRKFPFEKLTLPIELTAIDHWIDELVLTNQKEYKNSTFDKQLELQGYKLLGLKIEDKKRVFNTSFGFNDDALSSFGESNISIYPAIIASLSFQRAISSSIWNFFIPLITILSAIIFESIPVVTKLFRYLVVF